MATQNVTDPRLGPLALDLLQGGMRGTEAVAGLRDLAFYGVPAGPHD